MEKDMVPTNVFKDVFEHIFHCTPLSEACKEVDLKTVQRNLEHNIQFF